MVKRVALAGLLLALVPAIADLARAQLGGKPIPSDEATKILDQALAAANQAADGEAKVAALQTILRLEVHAGNSAEARRQTDALNKTDESRKYVMCEVAIAMALKGEGQKALVMLDSDPDAEFGDWCYDQMGGAEAELGDVGGVVASGAFVRDGEPRAELYASAAEAAFASGKTDATEKLFALARESAKTEEDANERILALFHIAFAMIRFKDSKGAEALLPEMQAALPHVEKDERDMSLVAISQVQGGLGRFADAEQTIKSIHGDAPPEFARSMMIRNLIARGDLAEAIKNVQLIGPGSYKNASIEEIAAERAHQGDFNGAFAMMPGVSDKFDIYNADSVYARIALEQAKHGKYEDARRTAHLLSEAKFRARTLILLGSNMPKNDNDRAADMFFSDARTAALSIEIDFYRAAALSHLAGVLSARGKFAEARAAADAIPSDAAEWVSGDVEKHKGSALGNIAYWQCKMGSCKEALEWSNKEGSPVLRGFALAGVVQAMMGIGAPADHYYEEYYG